MDGGLLPEVTSINLQMHNDTISIIMACYNASSYIEETIQSVIAQSYENWELIIADDKSSDASISLIRDICRKEPRITLIECAQNGGPAVARNTALAAANGRWVAFLDSDDLWLSDKLEKTIAKAKATDAALVCTGFRRFVDGADGKRRTGHFIKVPPRFTYRGLLGGNKIATSTVLIDTLKTGPIEMRDVYYDDFDCWLAILKTEFAVVGLNEDLMRYRVLQGSISRNKFKSAAHHWDSLRRLQSISLLPALLYFLRYVISGISKYKKL